MNIEYALHDIESNDKSIKKEIELALEYPIKQISVLPQHIKTVKKIVPKHINLSSIIDFPFGISSEQIRMDMIQFASDEGVDTVEIIAPNRMMCNRNYTSIRSEITRQFDLCVKNMIDVAYVLEYRRFTFTAIARVAKILTDFTINKCYASSGNKLDNIHDHLIAIAMLKKEVPDISIPFNGNLWLKEQVDLLYESDVKIARVRTLNALDLFFNKIA